MKNLITIIIIVLSGIALRQAAEAATNVNLAPVAEPSTSNVSRDTSLVALHDGHAPKVSHDRGKGAYGNWPSKGTQWVQYDWAAPVDTQKIDVFWWADGGGVGVPKACRVLYWDGQGFVPVRQSLGTGGGQGHVQHDHLRRGPDDQAPPGDRRRRAKGVPRAFWSGKCPTRASSPTSRPPSRPAMTAS